MKPLKILLLFLLILFINCDAKKANETLEPRKQEQGNSKTPDKASESAGIARMMEDGTIKMMLVIGDANAPGSRVIVEYKQDDPEYQELLEHIGGLKIGETKPVPHPWPKDRKSTDDIKVFMEKNNTRAVSRYN